MRELESQTVQLIGEKKSLETNLEEAKQQQQQQQTSAVQPAVPEADIDQVLQWHLPSHFIIIGPFALSLINLFELIVTGFEIHKVELFVRQFSIECFIFFLFKITNLNTKKNILTISKSNTNNWEKNVDGTRIWTYEEDA